MHFARFKNTFNGRDCVTVCADHLPPGGGGLLYQIDELIVINFEKEPRSTDTPLIRTPRYYGQFGISRLKAHTFL